MWQDEAFEIKLDVDEMDFMGLVPKNCYLKVGLQLWAPGAASETGERAYTHTPFPCMFQRLMPSFDKMAEIWGLRASKERGIGERKDQRCFQNRIRLRGEIKLNVAPWLRV